MQTKGMPYRSVVPQDDNSQQDKDISNRNGRETEHGAGEEKPFAAHIRQRVSHKATHAFLIIQVVLVSLFSTCNISLQASFPTMVID